MNEHCVVRVQIRHLLALKVVSAALSGEHYSECREGRPYRSVNNVELLDANAVHKKQETRCQEAH